MALTVLVEGKKYRVKSADELTLRDWRNLTIPRIETEGLKDDLEVTWELLKRHTGISKAKLRMANLKDVDALIEAIGDTLRDALTLKGKEEVPPQSFTHEGVTYGVPQDLELNTSYGQWVDFCSEIDKLEHDIDLNVHALSILCAPSPYDGDNDKRREAFWQLPITVGFPVVAFFFASSERFRTATGRSLSLYLTSLRLRTRLRLTGSRADTDNTPTSTGQPS